MEQNLSVKGAPIHAPRRLKALQISIALLLLGYLGELISLVRYAATDDLNSYVILVPFISAYLIYLKRHQLPKPGSSCSVGTTIAGTIALGAIAVDLFWRSSGQPLSENDHLALVALSFVCFIAAGGFFFLGRAWMASATFPMAFLFFMVPLPDRLVDWLETGSKLASAEAANLIFLVTGTPYFREGVFFQLPGITLEVAQECSGIRSSWVLLLTSLLASYLFIRSPWRRLVLVAFVLPLGIIRNGFRIAVIGWLCTEIGPHMIHSVIHKRGGPLFFALSLIPLFALQYFLRKGDGGPPTPPTRLA